MVNKNLKVAVLGAGAMGCLFGGLLAEKGLDVVLIDVWKDHVDEINNKGLKMMGHGGDRTVKIKATTDPKTLQPVDAIIIMCKATALEKALTNSKNIIGDKTMLMSFQNGIGHEEIMQNIAGKDKVLGGSTTQASMIQLKDDIKTLGDFKATIDLHSEVQVQIKIQVIPAESDRKSVV